MCSLISMKWSFNVTCIKKANISFTLKLIFTHINLNIILQTE